MSEQPIQTDLVIIGGGIMGLMSAYYASRYVKNIVILESRFVGNPEAASFSFTRSIRSDYLEPEYSRLAEEAKRLWEDLEKYSEEAFYIKCGCLNIATKAASPKLEASYALKSYRVAERLHLPQERYSAVALKQRFPQFRADVGTLDPSGGYLYLPAITKLLFSLLKEQGVTIKAYTETGQIKVQADGVRIATNQGSYLADQVILTAGKGTNELLKTLDGPEIQLPLTYDRPKRKYYYPPPELIKNYMPDTFPVFAYTDYGFYGHPIFDRRKAVVKVAYFVPVGMRQKTTTLTSIEAFVEACLPELSQVRSEEITDADKCWYDIVADDHFILGRLPAYNRITVGTGWRGTGYKFAPLIGKCLSEIALQNASIYDIAAFNPGRFSL